MTPPSLHSPGTVFSSTRTGFRAAYSTEIGPWALSRSRDGEGSRGFENPRVFARWIPSWNNPMIRCFFSKRFLSKSSWNFLVDLIEKYRCWSTVTIVDGRNPKQPPGMVLKPDKQLGKTTISTGDRRILSINRIITPGKLQNVGLSDTIINKNNHILDPDDRRLDPIDLRNFET